MIFMCVVLLQDILLLHWNNVSFVWFKMFFYLVFFFYYKADQCLVDYCVCPKDGLSKQVINYGGGEVGWIVSLRKNLVRNFAGYSVKEKGWDTIETLICECPWGMFGMKGAFDWWAEKIFVEDASRKVYCAS